MNIRRLPGFMYHYKVITLLLFTTMLFVIYLLLHWGIMCTNLEAWRHVSNVHAQKRSCNRNSLRSTMRGKKDSLACLRNAARRQRSCLLGSLGDNSTRVQGFKNESPIGAVRIVVLDGHERNEALPVRDGLQHHDQRSGR